MPVQVQDYLSNQAFASFSFDFVPVIDVPYVRIPIEELDFEHNDEKLKAIGIESGSSFVNNVGLLISIGVVVLLNVLFCLVPRPRKKRIKLSKARK